MALHRTGHVLRAPEESALWEFVGKGKNPRFFLKNRKKTGKTGKIGKNLFFFLQQGKNPLEFFGISWGLYQSSFVFLKKIMIIRKNEKTEMAKNLKNENRKNHNATEHVHRITSKAKRKNNTRSAYI